nr:YsnF/AvaK domain-containing protein [Pyrinomonadaceae bacterium]
YVEGVSAGKTLVYLKADDQKAKRAVAIMERYSAAQTATTGKSERGRIGQEGEVALPVMEEQLQVGKREVQGGGVRVHSSVTEKPVEETVALREETVHVERRPADRAVSQADMAAMRDGTIEMTETSEEAVVSKQARVVGEVVVSKDVTERQETVRDTVRRTDVDVEQLDTNTKAKGRSSDS